MKKLYTKPQIVFESFSLSTNIAAGCEFRNGLQTEGACGYETRNGITFTDEIGACFYKAPDNNDALCYHVPITTANIFNS